MANELSDLAPNPGSGKTRMRVGRGEGSGKGKTAGRGTKGDKSRSGYKTRPYFEGGQMPLHRRLPKRGFNNHDFARDIETVDVARLEGLAAGTSVTADLLLSSGTISRVGKDGVKVLGTGDISVAVHLKGLLVSAGARDKIVAAGGSVE